MKAWMLRSLVLSVSLSCVACGGAGATAATDGGAALPGEAVTSLIGEIHLHQFALGGHAWAAFLAAAIPLADVHTDELVELEMAPSAAEGACVLYLKPVCHPDCAVASYCAGNGVCRALPMVRYVDGGEIRITGSRVAPTIRLWYATSDMGYAADPPPGDAALFAGGEVLRVAGGMGADVVSGSLMAPLPVALDAPDPTVDLHFPTSAALDVRWAAGGASSIVVSLSASRADGDFAGIRCVTSDGGALVVARSLMAALPPPPRSIRIEVERENQEVLKTATPGTGILAHAAFSAWHNGMD